MFQSCISSAVLSKESIYLLLRTSRVLLKEQRRDDGNQNRESILKPVKERYSSDLKVMQEPQCSLPWHVLRAPTAGPHFCQYLPSLHGPLVKTVLPSVFFLSTHGNQVQELSCEVILLLILALRRVYSVFGQFQLPQPLWEVAQLFWPQCISSCLLKHTDSKPLNMVTFTSTIWQKTA